MTIAACYLSPEGVVFGADSTATVRTSPSGDTHFFDFGQKIFEIGHNATIGMGTWGLGSLPATSYRTLFAELADDLKATPPSTVQEAAERWANKFWSVYDSAVGSVYRQLAGVVQTPEDQKKLETLLENTCAGFCIGGIALPNRRPQAFELEFSAYATTG